MNFRHSLIAISVLGAALAAAMGVSQLRAAQDPLRGYCPSHDSTNCAQAAQMYLQFAHPTDAELARMIDAIAEALGRGHHSRRVYRDIGARAAFGAAGDTLEDRRAVAPYKDLNFIYGGPQN